jgi:poly(A) polymerase
VAFAADIEEDLSRRDFTINAMAVRLPDHRFVDPFGGLGDLRHKRLRTPLDPATSFGDDPLRMVRLARFAAVLQVTPDPAALAAATAMATQLDAVSRERIRDEFSRLLLGADPARGMDILCDTSLADQFIPEVPALRMARDPIHHHKDVYRHTMAVVARCPADDLVLRLAALLHDIGKPATREFHPDGKVTFHHHEVVGARMARARLRELRYPNDITDAVTDLVALHLRFHGYSEQGWTDRAVRRYVRDAGSQLERLNRLTRADVTTRNKAKARRLQRGMDELEERIAALREQEELDRLRPPLDGHQIMAHLGIRPGPLVGEAWNMLLEARLDRGPMGDEEAYALLDEWATERGSGRGAEG